MSKTFAMILAIAVMLVCQANSTEIKKEKLGFDFNVDKTFRIKEFQFAGQPLIIKYNVGVRDGKAFNQIKISSSLGLTTFGNNGTDTEKNGTWSGKTRIFNFRCPREPNLILGLIAEGSLQYSVKYATDSKDSLKISLEGNLKARVEVVSNQGRYTQVHAKTQGTIISVSGYATVTKNDVIKEFKFSGTEIKTELLKDMMIPPFAVYREIWRVTYKLFDNWSY